MKWAIVIERAPDGSYGGYVPDLPGIGVGGDSPEEVRERLATAIALYFEDETERPQPASMVEYLETAP
jgi:predicted RNase H-like HicB family nuclease